MKKFIALVLSAVLFSGMLTPMVFAVGEQLDDGVSDASKMYSHSDNLIFESNKTLGSYENAAYATSAKNTVMEIVYSLENTASFEVVTLNYKKAENIEFYSAASADGEYKKLDGYSSQKEALDEKGTWEKLTYTGAVEDGTNYFKIVINQTQGGKYIRLDNVKLMPNIELEASEFALFSGDEKMSGLNVSGADRLKIKFNQPIADVPELKVAQDGAESKTYDGSFGTGQSEVVYDIDTLDFDIYSFAADFKAVSGKEYSLDIQRGAKAVYSMPDAIHFGESYTAEGYIEKCVDFEGGEYAAENVSIESDNEDIISVSDGAFCINKAGEALISSSFTFGGESAKTERTITVYGAERLITEPKTVSLSKGEKKEFSVKVLLTDGAEATLESYTAETTDYTVAEIEKNVIKASGNGTAFINITADYYGTTLYGVIAVGVGTDAPEAITNADLALNRYSLTVGESVYGVINCFSENGRLDLISFDKKYYSTDPSVAFVSDDGKITAVSAGETEIYAEISLGGVTVSTNRVSLSVSEDVISKAEIVLPAYYMNVSDELDISVAAFTKLGEKIDNAKIKYTVSGTAASISGGKLKGISKGAVQIKAAAEYNGVSVSTKSVTVEVTENVSKSGKNFAADGDINGENIVDCSSDLFASSGTGLMTRSDSVTYPNQYVTLKSNEEIKRIKLSTYYINDVRDDDIQLFVSSDNKNYVRVPHGDMNITQKNDNGAWYYMWLEYDGALLSGVRYVRALIGRPASEHAQGIRILDVTMEHDIAPQISGVSITDKNGVKTDSISAANVAVSFSGSVDESTLGGISLKYGDNTVSESGSYENGIYTLPVDKLQSGEYTLCANGVKNEWGTEMTPYEYKFTLGSGKKASVTNVAVKGTEVSADIINIADEDLRPVIITEAFDSEGSVTDIYIDINTQLSTGSNSYICPKDFTNVSSARVFVWRDLTELCIY